MHFILASQSRARAKVLQQAGIQFQAMPAHIDEHAVKQSGKASGMSAAEVTTVLAAMKAEKISQQHPEALVLGADQILVCGDVWFDKAPDIATAKQQLMLLSGKSHMLLTAVVFYYRGNRIWQHLAVPALTMRVLPVGEIEQYLQKTGSDILESVGCYQIEGLGITLFEAIDGDYFSIMGLPILPVLTYLRGRGDIE